MNGYMFDSTILNNIRIAGGMGDEMARVIYFLGNGGNIKAVENDFVHQWWRANAYQQVHKGHSTLDEQRALWRELCKACGFIEYADYDSTDDFKHMDEFYKKMGWK